MSFEVGQRRERARVRSLLFGTVRPRAYYETQAYDNQQMNAFAVQVTEAGAYEYVVTGNRELVAAAMRAASEDLSPLKF